MEFIREKIKEKPISRRKILKSFGVAAVCGVIFGLMTCAVLLMFLPKFRSVLVKAGATETGTLTESDMSVLPGSEEVNESQTTGDSETEHLPGDTQIVIPDISLSINDYQKLQNELYQIGTTANKSIVTVTSVVNETDWMNNSYETEGQGSGVIISKDNNYLYILTERKVIADASRIRVAFIDNTSAEATVLKYDGNTGVVILTVENRLLEDSTKEEIAVAKLGNSFSVTNGTIVIALGSPLGTNYSILTGNITSTNNEIMTLDHNYAVFTTDIVASEKGSGILINTKGEVIGMVIQAFSGSQDMSTLTAISISEINGIIQRLVNGKDIPYVGLYVSTVTNQISHTYDIPKGVFIKEVLTDSPAMYAGLQSGDVITQINGEDIYEAGTYSTKIRMLIPGTTCEITVKRQNGNGYIEVKCEVEVGILK